MRRILLLLPVVALMVVAGGVAWAANIQCPNGDTNNHAGIMSALALEPA